MGGNSRGLCDHFPVAQKITADSLFEKTQFFVIWWNKWNKNQITLENTIVSLIRGFIQSRIIWYYI